MDQEIPKLRSGITTHWNGPAGRNGPWESQDSRAPGRPFNADPLCRRGYTVNDFGKFHPLFGGTGGYLSLLRLRSDDSFESVARVLRIVRAGDVSADIDRMLSDVNWRPHLVGCVAMLVAEESARLVPTAWLAVDSGSWVTPQLIACLAFADPCFPDEARTRLSSQWQVAVPEVDSDLQRHVATGPGGSNARSGKAMASLVAACSLHDELLETAEAARADVNVQAALSHDIDKSGDILQGWRQRVLEFLGDLGEVPRIRWLGRG